MKKLLTTLTVLLLVGLMVLPGFAHRRGGSGYHGDYGPGGCWHGNRPYANLNESQMAEVEKLEKKYFSDSGKLKEQIWTKSEELYNLLSESNPDPDKARALQREISDLKAKMAENKLNYQLEARKLAPDAPLGSGCGRGHGSAYHHGCCGHGGPYGHRGPEAGHGHGPCWQ